MSDTIHKSPELKAVPISSIIVKPRKRPLRQTDELAKSIQQIGLLNPIAINANNELIAGHHRLFVCKELGWTDIPAQVVVFDCEGYKVEEDEAQELLTELSEIDENLIRNELDDLEQGEHLLRHDEILAELGQRAVVGQGRPKNGDIMSPLKTSLDIANQMGISERESQRLKQIARNIAPEVKDSIRDTELADKKVDLLHLARLEPEKQRQVVEKIQTGQSKNVRDAESRIRQEERHERLEVISNSNTDVAELDKTYSLIYCDPPWRYEFSKDSADDIEEHYPTMPIEDICTLPVYKIAESDCVLFMWTTAPKLEESFEVIRSWGFNYKTNMVWVKSGLGMGYYARGKHEILMIATKGTPPVPLPENRPASVLEAPKTAHSAKPHEFYEIIERMYPHASKVELFCRSPREGWDVWGNQANDSQL